MPTLYTDAQRDALRAAIAKGVRRVKFSTSPGVMQEIEYASMADMIVALAIIDRELTPNAPGNARYYLTRYDGRR